MNQPAGLSRVILVGDSVALVNGLAVGAALGAAGVEFHSMASAGGGTVVGPPAARTWAELPGRPGGGEGRRRRGRVPRRRRGLGREVRA